MKLPTARAIIWSADRFPAQIAPRGAGDGGAGQPRSGLHVMPVAGVRCPIPEVGQHQHLVPEGPQRFQGRAQREVASDARRRQASIRAPLAM